MTDSVINLQGKVSMPLPCLYQSDEAIKLADGKPGRRITLSTVLGEEDWRMLLQFVKANKVFATITEMPRGLEGGK